MTLRPEHLRPLSIASRLLAWRAAGAHWLDSRFADTKYYVFFGTELSWPIPTATCDSLI